jgi:hypothetical protein
MADLGGATIRRTVLETVQDLAQKGGGALAPEWVLREVRDRLAVRDDINLHRAILDFFNDLFRTGQLAWGTDLNNFRMDGCHLTELGRKTLEHLSRDPANPDGYLAHLRNAVAPGTIAWAYAEEAVCAYAAGRYKSAAVMIGGAAERLVLDLAAALVARMQHLGKKTPKKLGDWRVKTLLDGIGEALAPQKPAMPVGLAERFDSHWPAFAQEIRAARNDAGHPSSIDPVTPETVQGNLLIFPEMARLAADLTAWVAKNYS